MKAPHPVRLTAHERRPTQATGQSVAEHRNRRHYFGRNGKCRCGAVKKPYSVAEHLDANPGHYLRRDGTCHCGLKPAPLEFPLRTVRTAPHRRLYHYWSTVRAKAFCMRDMRLRILSDYDEGQTICADCTRVKAEHKRLGVNWEKPPPGGTQEADILKYTFGTPAPLSNSEWLEQNVGLRVLPSQVRSQNTHPIRSRYHSRRVRS